MHAVRSAGFGRLRRSAFEAQEALQPSDLDESNDGRDRMAQREIPTRPADASGRIDDHLQTARVHERHASDVDDDITRSFSFEVSVCRFALAQLAPIFAYDLGAIAVLDEAQFCQRRVRFSKADETGEIMLDVSSTIDGSIDLDLAIGSAIAVLKALDLDLESTGDVPLAVLRKRLADDAVRSNFVAQRVEQYLTRLDRLAAIEAQEQDSRLVWA